MSPAEPCLNSTRALKGEADTGPARPAERGSGAGKSGRVPARRRFDRGRLYQFENGERSPVASHVVPPPISP